MTGRVDSIHYQRAVVRDEVVPYEGHLWNRSSCRPNSRWAIDNIVNEVIEVFSRCSRALFHREPPAAIFHDRDHTREFVAVSIFSRLAYSNAARCLAARRVCLFNPQPELVRVIFVVGSYDARRPRSGPVQLRSKNILR